jgi:hypothetical protein
MTTIHPIDPKLVEAVVRWWSSLMKYPADKLAQDKLPFHATRVLTNARRAPVPQEKVAVFEATLRALLLDPKQHRRGYGMFAYPTVFDLETDYEPRSQILIEALKAAGIAFFHLPFKTRMEIRDGVVTIGSGDRKGTRVYPPTEKIDGPTPG